VYLVPSSIKANDIARVMREGYDVGLLNDGFRQLVKELSLDVLLLDTHPGLNEETLLSIAMSNALAIVLRPDHQDYEGTSVTLSVARKLKVPDLVLVVNKMPPVFDPEEVRGRVQNAYGCEVSAVLPHSDELMALSSGDIFALRYPDHPVTGLLRQIAARLTA
jgi:MinD-like ATPase involved in chromosome partitioning or flagellar assembly